VNLRHRERGNIMNKNVTKIYRENLRQVLESWKGKEDLFAGSLPKPGKSIPSINLMKNENDSSR
jgi:hypothetical protein